MPVGNLPWKPTAGIGWEEQLKIDVQSGLAAAKKRVPSLLPYLRDNDLFTLIASEAVPEYPFTRAELVAWQKHGGRIAEILKEYGNLPHVEYGPGKGQNTLLLLEKEIRCGIEPTYLGLDLSSCGLQKLQQSVPRDVCYGSNIVLCEGDYSFGHQHLLFQDQPVALLFLGGNISNYALAEKLTWLSQQVPSGSVLVVSYHNKMADHGRLKRAYANPITDSFVRDAFTELNERYAGNMPVEFLENHTYVDQEGHIQMEVSLPFAYTLRLQKLGFKTKLAAHERIRESSSHKHSSAEFQAGLAQASRAGKALQQVAVFTDPEQLVSISLIEVK
jgi:uncharacterized SAM-dependent methyltransferase